MNNLENSFSFSLSDKQMKKERQSNFQERLQFLESH